VKAKPVKRKKALDDDGNVKVRAPTAYNLFVKEQRPIVKKANPNFNNPTILCEIARLWKVKKGLPIAEVVESMAAMASMAYFEDSSSDDESSDEE
jgi:hypothetical protein